MIKKRDPEKTSKLGMDINDAEIKAWNEALNAVVELLNNWHKIDPYNDANTYTIIGYVEGLKK